ncbi:hypothetical protein VB264_23250 [Arcicella aquatica]|uniref:Uncharacterized protein n=1 Tax=Arcicella aquatica TaxID=217141 RepID=A0ABU5QV65_9BACT|nr:hypothetical protein [Arcicella aquatica]MEA5260735.1 hypothetical protein [Arcicella aquatica]
MKYLEVLSVLFMDELLAKNIVQDMIEIGVKRWFFISSVTIDDSTLKSVLNEALWKSS